MCSLGAACVVQKLKEKEGVIHSRFVGLDSVVLDAYRRLHRLDTVR